MRQVQGDFCRIWSGSRHPQEVFIRHACANCYKMMPDVAFISQVQKLWYNNESGLLVDLITNDSYDLQIFHSAESAVLSTFRSMHYIQKWTACCHAAKSCCKRMMKNIVQVGKERHCPMMWDGLQCWPETLADQDIEMHCPDYIYVAEEPSHCSRYVIKECLHDGKWKLSDQTGMETTDYSSCLPLEFGKQTRNKSSRSKCCRTERRVELSYESYRLDTCARCYMYMPSSTLRKRFIYNRDDATLRDPTTNVTYYADYENESHPIYQSFWSRSAGKKWKECCQEAQKCCHQMMTESTNHEQSQCEQTWDGWQCFPRTLPGDTAFVTCPDHVYFNEKPPCPKYAEKYCTSSGKWYYDYRRSKEWTSYHSCGRVDDIRKQMIFLIAMYGISVLFLMPALIIFFVYKQLEVFRISMHKQFFFSLLLNGGSSIVFKSVVIPDESDYYSGLAVIDQNGNGCKFLFILTKYFRMTNYMWMFSEGFYLHKLISAGFVEQRNLIVYYFIGWVFPLLPTSIYGLLRKLFYDDRCWVIPAEHIEWILNGPNLVGIVTNLVFLCDIIRVLITKLRATHASEPSQYRKAVRATLVLVPLFGLHFLFIFYRPNHGGCSFLTGYRYFSHTLDGLQGFLVALIFCYCNGEVLYLLKRTYHRWTLSSFHSNRQEGGSSKRKIERTA